MNSVSEARLEIMVNAAGAGHDLGLWEETPTGDGWQARCRKCGGTIWVGKKGLQYSLLEDVCPASRPSHC